MSVYDGQVVCVTGGAGSFGQFFVRHALRRGAAKVIALGRDEWKLARLAEEIADNRLRVYLGDVRDQHRMRRAFAGVDVVVHAAALKRVEALQRDPIEAVRTNVDGTANAVEAVLDSDVRAFVLLSSDKAVSPANLYGATKLVAEHLVLNAQTYTGSRRQGFGVVRYGNVLASRGSVLWIWADAVARGLPLKVAYEATRYVMTFRDAISLVDARVATIFAQGCSPNRIEIPAAPAIGLGDLANAMHPGYPQEAMMLSPGEKAHEDLLPGWAPSSRDAPRAGAELLAEIRDEFQLLRGWMR